MRRAEYGHIEQIVSIEAASFPDPWSRASFLSELDGQGTHFFVAERKDALLGYCIFRSILDEGEIFNIAVAPEYRGQGIGEAMVNKIIELGQAEGLSTIYLEVRAGNLPAKWLYVKMGFRAVGIRRGYYLSPKEDAIIMAYKFQ